MEKLFFILKSWGIEKLNNQSPKATWWVAEACLRFSIFFNSKALYLSNQLRIINLDVIFIHVHIHLCIFIFSSRVWILLQDPNLHSYFENNLKLEDGRKKVKEKKAGEFCHWRLGSIQVPTLWSGLSEPYEEQR